MAFKVVLMAILALAGASGCRPAKVPDQDRQLLPPRGGSFSGGEARGVVLGPFSSLNDDCTLRSLARVRILQAPRNGTLQIGVRQGTASFGAENAFARCNGSPIRGTYAYYTPNPGYTGPEHFRIEVVFGNGERRVLAPSFSVTLD
jgi:hypothetical protein